MRLGDLMRRYRRRRSEGRGPGPCDRSCRAQRLRDEAFARAVRNGGFRVF